MDKIMKAALTGKFGAEAVPSIMEVIGNTPNAVMAAEILLGVYTPIELVEVINNKRLKTLVNVDEWNNRVTYRYEEVVTKTLYVANDCDTSLITMDNYKEFEVPYSRNDSKYFSLETGEISARKDSCGIDEWMSWTRQSSNVVEGIL
jgi:hypothetical protein